MTDTLDLPSGLRVAPAVASVSAYAPARHPAPTDLDLSGSAGSSADPGADFAGIAGELTRRAAKYPEVAQLTARLAKQIGVPTERLLITAGADDALERAFRSVLTPGREVLLTTPTFEMLPRYARLTGATIRQVAWPSGPLPTHELVAAISPETSLVAIVSPNNPTGAVASLADLLTVTRAAPNALLLVDLAYVEFADADPTRELLREPRVLVTRTFSKAWALPGLRVGWAAGPPEVITWMQRAGSPFPIAGTSLALVESALERLDTPSATVSAVRDARARLTALLDALGLDPLPSQANFVCVASTQAPWVRDALAGQGIAVRYLPDRYIDRLRIACPTGSAPYQRLAHALTTSVAPEGLIFDMDGVLADVSRSYRTAIINTAATFGVTVTTDEIRDAKAQGNANDDWQLTAALLAAHGTSLPLEEVTMVFEAMYQGGPGRPGLREMESLLTTPERLTRLASRYRLGIATGRPRADAERFLARFGISRLFACCVTKEDGPGKPDAFPITEAMERLGVTRAWMIGDTPDDIRSARAAGALPLGVLAPQDHSATMSSALLTAGAARVLTGLDQLEELLP